MKTLNFKKLTVVLILIAIFLLYILFLILDLDNMYKSNISDKLKYISILLCFVLSLLIDEYGLNHKDTLLLQLGLLFTTLADLFFLILDFCELGVITFCLVQIIYFMRYLSKNNHYTVIKLITFIVITTIIYLTLSIFSKNIMFLFMVAFIYTITLIASVIRSIKSCKEKYFPSPNRYMIVVGMMLFMLCDINVGLSYLASNSNFHCTFLNKYEATSSFLIWLFYLPSQVLLALSGYDFDKLNT
ncbi:MAG: hypothetical protein GX895_13625 [Clostridiales bacterium]|uniref:lysoplasmalogenase family protein n=1 Tax=Clostridium sp. N3C TaxID=1776758 RepID=UPI00092E0A89|nr:lysoplasmalogenase family protein [Clostridium sp. N3C]NLZ49791.1 hypothetical protein [Clostridiales bacterium]SCN23361.1 YhhN-like protein [Clostridium sp. N3C]